jgi:hypothetical protein
MALLLTAAGAPAAEPGEQEYPGHQHDPADPEHPEDSDVAAGEGVHQQEAQGEQEEQDSYPRSPAPHSLAVAPAAPAISARLVRRRSGVGSAACGPRAAAGASGAGNGEPLASLQLGELPDVVAVFPRVLAGIDPLRPQVLSGDAEDLGEVGANPFLAILLAAAALTVGGVCRSRAGTRISHASNCTSPNQDSERSSHASSASLIAVRFRSSSSSPSFVPSRIPATSASRSARPAAPAGSAGVGKPT